MKIELISLIIQQLSYFNKNLLIKELKQDMECFGARNTRGFSSQIESGELPDPTHITYEGVFNEIKFNVGPKTQLIKDLHFGYARSQFTKSLHDNSINDYLAIFMKGKQDGEDRDARPLNALICLDISGSMGGGLGSDYNYNTSRLDLSKEAIKMFISKLRPNDAIGMITFNDQAQVIFEVTLKSQIGQKVYKAINNIQTNGGTTIKSGFVKSKQMLTNWIQSKNCHNCENRIIMLTDVSDNSISNEQLFLQKASSESNINLTIIGISDQFQSTVCEKLKNVKGFNYFCAVNEEDIKKYVFQTFDFGFFPSAYDINLQISSDDIESFQIFGAPDSDLVLQYNDNFVGNPTTFTISKLKSTFPSQIQIINQKVLTVGGLILVKLQRKTKNPFFKGEVTLQYTDPFGKLYEQKYQINYEFHPEQQFFSEQSLRQAIQGFTFTSQMKVLLKEANNYSKQMDYHKYWTVVNQLEQITPKSKITDLQNIKNIIKERLKVKQ